MTQIFIVSGTSWTVPADWNSADNTVETIGAGGGGQTADAVYAGSGGGGGAYSKITNLSLTAGSSITIQVGSGGAAGNAGGDTWFNGSTLAASSVGAKGGGGGADQAGGAGGAAASGVGAVTYSGGHGGTDNFNPYGGAGGGGAAGPNGAGSSGTGSMITTDFGGGGGGGNGGGSSTMGASPSGAAGGNGGAAADGTAGGSGGSGGGVAGGVGSHGSGGGGGGGNVGAGGGNGGNGIEWASAYGSGGGGGGGGGAYVSGAGGSGGLYGGGGGGGGYAGSGFAPGGSGSQGLIVVTYTPTASAAVTAESWSALEAQETTRADQPGAIESGLIIVCNSWPLTEAGASTWHNDVIGIDFGHITAGDLSFPAEWAGAVAVTADASARLEAGARFSFDATVPLGAGSRALQDTVGFGEWSETHSNQGWMVAVEQLAAVRGDCRPQIECVGRLSSDAQTCVEWADPQGLLLVSSERLLSPPARIRILANTSSGHPLRGQ